MKKYSTKKITKGLIKGTFNVFLIVMLLVSESFAANIIYAPTQSVQTTAVTDYNYYDDSSVTAAESEVISSLNEDASYANYVTVFNIVEENNSLYCYDNGRLVKNAWRKISKESFSNIGSVDAYHDSYIWAYFQSNGKAIRASSGKIKKTKIGASTYAFNEYGMLLLGFFNDSGEMWDESQDEDPFGIINDGNLYHADEVDGKLTAGWYKLNGTTSRYENKTSIWMYFNTSTFRATRSTGNNYKKLIVGGNTYAFDDNGVMLTGFEPLQYNQQHGGNTTNIPYFGSDGAEVKSGFVDVDTSDDLNYEIYGDPDEDITIYLNKSGKLYTNTIKKVGNYYYGFTSTGVVVKGLSVWNGTTFVSYISNENTNGKQFIISGIYVDKDGVTHTLSSGETIHYFDNKGHRVTNSTKLEFADDYYTYAASNSGAYNGTNSKKFYAHGLLLKPMNDAKYGVVVVNPTKTTYSMSEICNNSNVYVVNSSGTIVSSSSSSQKDENDCYWLLSGTMLINIYTINVRKNSSTYTFRSTNTSGNEAWINFGTKDSSGNTCITSVTANGTRLSSGAVSNYQTKLHSDSALNFYIS